MKIAALKVTVDALKKDKIKQSHGKIFSNLQNIDKRKKQVALIN